MRSGLVAIIGLVAALSGPATVGALAAPSDVFVTSVRDVCHLPRPQNDGKVVGHDVGSSVRLGGTTYFLFGDTYTDTNGDGGLSPSELAFPQTGGTIARTTDSSAADCIDGFHYKNSGGTATPLLPLAPGEDCMWAGAPVVANGQVYFYYDSVRAGHCTLTDFQADTALAKLTGNPQDLNAARVGSGTRPLFWTWGQPEFMQPLRVDDAGQSWIYVFGLGTPFAPDLYLARVPEAQIETLSAYRYWNGSGWSTSVSQSPQSRIFSDNTNKISNTPTIFYNTALGRYLAIYSCGVNAVGDLAGTQICARTAVQSGQSAGAITGGWNDPKVIYDCPNDATLGPYLDCYAGFQHAEYGSGDTVYITAARKTGLRYWLMLREFKLSAPPPQPGTSFTNAASDFSTTQAASGWTYLARNGSGQESQLAWSGFWKEWIGAGTCAQSVFSPVAGATLPAPALDEDGGYPGPSCDPVREWSVPSLGSVRISGEAWNEYACGDGAKAEIVRIRRGTRAVVWSRSLSAGGSEIYDSTVSVKKGDVLAFRVARQGTETCDNVYLNPTMVFTRAPDADSDGFSDTLEMYLGTDPNVACPAYSGHDAYPPDLVGTGGTGTHDGEVKVNDILAEVSHYGGYVARYDLDGSGIGGSGRETVADILVVVGEYGGHC